ncbi:DUF2306 domain-containing protein [Brevundimonas sp.]|uniref:DUF2306 domain-containing protein n=1 Tax=Brevundimonas sp. TaxID=1871086 RepID=UPI002FC91086
MSAHSIILIQTRKWARRTGWAFLLLLCLAVAAYSGRYLVNPPQTIQQALHNVYGLPWLVVHVAGSVTALALGAWQFIPAWRRTTLGLHRWIGRTYVVSCLIGGAAGLVLAAGTRAGPVAASGFGLLGVLWIAVNVLGWRAAVQQRFDAHRRWMIRSWALTLAAVTLRIYLPLVMIFGLPFEPWYSAIAFLAWVPNLVLAELWLRRDRNRRGL